MAGYQNSFVLKLRPVHDILHKSFCPGPQFLQAFPVWRCLVVLRMLKKIIEIRVRNAVIIFSAGQPLIIAEADLLNSGLLDDGNFPVS